MRREAGKEMLVGMRKEITCASRTPHMEKEAYPGFNMSKTADKRLLLLVAL